MKTEIIYEDKMLLVVRKPAGLAVQTARVAQADVASELKNYLKTPYLGVIHRLDQPVEGLLVFAKTKEAAAALSGQLGEGVLKKRYYTAICGKPVAEQGELVDYLYKDTKANRSLVVGQQDRIRYPEAKKAVLRYRLLAYAEEQDRSLLEIQIDTGRFHQIRAQMAHAGMALLGDVKYGEAEAKGTSGSQGGDNLALCAYYLEFQHPAQKKRMCFQIRPEGKAFSCFHYIF